MDKKCAIVDEKVNPCGSLERALDDDRKGLRYIQLYNLKDMKESRGFVAVHSGEFRKKGVAINFCPFCGERIFEHMLKKEGASGE